MLTNSRFFPFPCFPLFSPRPLNASSTRRPSTAYSERYILHPRPAALILSTASPSLPQLRIPTFIRAQCPCVPLVRIHPITIRFGTHVFPGTIYVPPPRRWGQTDGRPTTPCTSPCYQYATTLSPIEKTRRPQPMRSTRIKPPCLSTSIT